MDYGATTILIYGIAIDESFAELLDSSYMNSEGTLSLPGTVSVYFRKAPSRPSKNYHQNPQSITPYSQHTQGGDATDEVFYPALLSDGTDSRVDSLAFDSGYDHFLGIHICSKGYAYQDNLTYFMQNLPLEVVEKYKQLIEPLLKKHGISGTPEIHSCNQTW